MHRHTTRLIAAFALLACGRPDSAADAARLHPPKRQIAQLGTPVLEIRGSVADTLLLDPGPMQIDDRFLYVFDYGDFRLKALDARTGTLSWAAGRSGEGPGEFKNPSQISLGSGDSEVWVIDSSLGRVSVVSAGQFRRQFSLPSDSDAVERIVRLVDQSLATVRSPRGHYFARMDTSGELTDFAEFPAPDLSAANPFHRQSLIAVDPKGRLWAAAFLFSNTFAVYDGRRLRCMGVTPVGIPIAELGAERNPKIWLASVAFVGTLVAVLARSVQHDRLDTIDFFSVTDCAYVESVELPGPARSLVAYGKRFVVHLRNPAPTLVAYHLDDVRR